jgi:hypothetical protein
VPVGAQLSRGRVLLGVAGLAIFVLTFTPTPFSHASLLHFFNFDSFR